MLHHDYLVRHNGVVKCIHLGFCIKNGIKKPKELRLHKVVRMVENSNATIKSDMTIQTDIKVQHNKPDLVIHDKKNSKIIIVK